jgi:sulfite reductase (NADPH) flavoprotein alpha-component
MNIDFTLPSNAPFNIEQRKWLKDYFSHKAALSRLAESRKITILWGSQTGNSASLARQAEEVLTDAGFYPTVVDLAKYDTSKLTSEEFVLFITSTYGGVPPDNARNFFSWILKDDAPVLESLRYAVLGLGDTNYPDFCKAAVDLDTRLQELGAQALCARHDCDVEYDEHFKNWCACVLGSLGRTNAAKNIQIPVEPEGYGKKNPFPATILKNYNLNGPASVKETYHIELSLEGSGFTYKPGDALAVYPMNPPEVVDEMLKLLPFDATEGVPHPDGGIVPLREALIRHYDIRKLNKAFLGKWMERTDSPLFRAVVESDDRAVINEFLWGRELIDLLHEFPAKFENGADFVSLLKKLQPRLYSIASSLNAHPGEVHLTVSVVRYESRYRKRNGVCSSFLSDRSAGIQPRVFVHHNKVFALPENTDTDVIMVGPGAGIAPFRSFLEERQVSGAKGRNWLFFGDQYSSCDFLYKDELLAMQADGVLTNLSTAFSRDQREKIYVQHRMLEQGAELWDWLNSGACFYVCGDAARMAKDVDQALRVIAQQHGGLSEDGAADFIKQLRKEKRYARDVY